MAVTKKKLAPLAKNKLLILDEWGMGNGEWKN